MKCVTVHQPWASLIASGVKPIENRSRLISYRGPLAIHAGLSDDWREPWWESWLKTNVDGLAFGLPKGQIIAVVDLVDAVRISDLSADSVRSLHLTGEKIIDGKPFNFACGPCCWLVKNARPLPKPIEFRGQQGVFNLPASIVNQINRQSREAA